MNPSHLIILVFSFLGLALALVGLRAISIKDSDQAPTTPQITTVQMEHNVRCYVFNGYPPTMDCVQLWMPEELQQ
jgi:hypothetical protein